jgi:hypothetical protein
MGEGKRKRVRRGAYDHLKPLLIELLARCPRCHRSTTTKLFNYVSDPPDAKDGPAVGCEECRVYWLMSQHLSPNPFPLEDFDREEALFITRSIVALFEKTEMSPLLARLQNRPPTDEEVALLAAEVQRGRVADQTTPDRLAERLQ